MIRSTFISLLLLLSAGAAAAADAQLGDIYVTGTWSRALPPVAPTGAAYMHIENRGSQPERLIGVATPIAKRAEIHEHAHADGVMRMQRVDSVVIEPGESLRLAPGAHHVMLFGLQQPLVAGTSYPLTLQFEPSGELEVPVDIRDDAPPAAVSHGNASGHDIHHH